MKVQVKSIGFQADQKLIDHLESKATKIEKYHNNVIDLSIVMKLENSGQVKDKIVEILLNVPKATIKAEDSCKTFENAYDNALKSAIRQLKKHKEKQQSRSRA